MGRSRSPYHLKNRGRERGPKDLDPRERTMHHRRPDHRRSRSPRRSHERPSKHENDRKRSNEEPGLLVGSEEVLALALPFEARLLSKNDFKAFEPLLDYYLDIQKGKSLQGMDEREVRGRWKSFIGKWNRSELAEGWYDPEMFSRISVSGKPTYTAQTSQEDARDTKRRHVGDGSDEDEYGPSLPTSDNSRQAAASTPTVEDIALRDEMIVEDARAAKSVNIAELQEARKAHRRLQKEDLEEILPRAEAGTRERKLEKRQMVNEKMREFRDKSPGLEGGSNDKELMGEGDSLAEFKQMKEMEQRKKTERELRREEIDRAKREEIEKRRRAWQEREEGTVNMLRELAKQRFG